MKVYLFLLITTLVTYQLSAKELTTSYPEILDFYPSCNYEVLEKYSVNSKIDDPTKQTEATNDLLTKLRKKALSIGADAVIIVNKKSKQKINAYRIKILTIRFEAELIKRCENNKKQSQKSTLYDHLGRSTAHEITKTLTNTRSFQFSFSLDNSVERPEILNKEVSLKNGLYGVLLGTSYQKVIDILGTPSTSLQVFTDELIIGYGRRHWLHFQSNKLVKIQTNPSVLSQTLINEITLLDFFDDFQWKINNKVAYKTHLPNIKNELDIKTKLNKKLQLVVQNAKEKLILHFKKNVNGSQDGFTYTLNGFTLQNNDYTAAEEKVVIDRTNQFKVVNNIVSLLNEKQPINSDLTLSQLGNPLGYVQRSSQEKLVIFNNNLLLKIKGNDIKSIHLVEELLSENKQNTNTDFPWYLGKFEQGKSIESLRNNFPADHFESDDTVGIDNEEFQLSLYFEEVGSENLLYEAIMTLY